MCICVRTGMKRGRDGAGEGGGQIQSRGTLKGQSGETLQGHSQSFVTEQMRKWNRVEAKIPQFLGLNNIIMAPVTRRKTGALDGPGESSKFCFRLTAREVPANSWVEMSHWCWRRGGIAGLTGHRHTLPASPPQHQCSEPQLFSPCFIPKPKVLISACFLMTISCAVTHSQLPMPSLSFRASPHELTWEVQKGNKPKGSLFLRYSSDYTNTKVLKLRNLNTKVQTLTHIAQDTCNTFIQTKNWKPNIQ